MKFLGIIFVLMILVVVISGACNGKKDDAGGGSSYSSTSSYSNSGRVTEDQVIRDTKTALDLAQQASGVRATGFTSDHCVIGDTKAVCHFHCYVDGVKHIGAMEFDIQGAKLVPSGKYFLTPDR